MRVVLVSQLLWDLLQVMSRRCIQCSFRGEPGNDNFIDKAQQYETMKSLNKFFFLREMNRLRFRLWRDKEWIIKNEFDS